MFIAVARLSLSIPESGSLKSKRHVVHKVLDKVRARFNVSISEVADLDLWQKATIGIAAVANEHAFAQESVSKVVRFIEELYVAPVLSCSTEIIPIGDELYGADDGLSTGSAARGAHRTLAEAELEAEGDNDDAPPPSLYDYQRPEKPGGRFGNSRGKRAMTEKEREEAIEELRQRFRKARKASAESESDENDE